MSYMRCMTKVLFLGRGNHCHLLLNHDWNLRTLNCRKLNGIDRTVMLIDVIKHLLDLGILTLDQPFFLSYLRRVQASNNPSYSLKRLISDFTALSHVISIGLGLFDIVKELGMVKVLHGTDSTEGHVLEVSGEHNANCIIRVNVFDELECCGIDELGMFDYATV